jgi:hypothetical protein
MAGALVSNAAGGAMSTRQEGQRRSEQKALEAGLLESVLRDNVMLDLGRPAGLHHVQVRLVFGTSYRVNVYVGEDAASAKVAHSYFVQADGDGKILSSSPAIVRAY